jgi:hypothetical protein
MLVAWRGQPGQEILFIEDLRHARAGCRGITTTGTLAPGGCQPVAAVPGTRYEKGWRFGVGRWVEPRDWPLEAPCPTCGGIAVTESQLTVNTWRHYTWECRRCGTRTHWAVHHHRLLHPQTWNGPRKSIWTATR